MVLWRFGGMNFLVAGCVCILDKSLRRDFLYTYVSLIGFVRVDEFEIVE